MKIARYTPAFELSRLAHLEPWARSSFTHFPVVGALLNEFLPTLSAGRLATDVFEDADHYYARFEVPGVKKENVTVELHQNVLTVTAERRVKSGDQEESFNLSRSVNLPADIQAEAIQAKLEDGILTITLPKPQQQKPKLIPVN